VSVGGFSPRVSLVESESSQHPFALTVAAAWTCYAPRPSRIGNVLKLFDEPDPPDDGVERAARRERAAKLYPSLFEAGHHTTFQHANFVFLLDGVSRLAIWSFLHHHPHYNSEQVSQRYREVTGKSFVTPPLPEAAAAIYAGAVERAFAGYQRLVELLVPSVAESYRNVFPARLGASNIRVAEKAEADVRKRAQEVARYVLPLATPAHLYHTINGLTLLRYYVLANQLDVPDEVRLLVNAMVAEVAKVDPRFLGPEGHALAVEQIPLEQTLEYAALTELGGQLRGTGDDEFFREFDAQLADGSSRLVDWSANGEALLADAVRTVLGVSRSRLIDADAIARVLDPRQNPYLSQPLFLGMNSKLMLTLNHVNFTFQKRISGAEDAQNQRHRGTLGSRPVLLAHLRPEPDVIVPHLVARVPAALEEYQATVGALWSAKNRLLDMGIAPEHVLYLLPNAHHVRLHESGSLLGYYWKWIKRLCYAAQREIFDTAREEVEQVAAVMPTIARYVARPPCVVRSEAGSRPVCPEGERFCGVTVWRDYEFARLAERRRL
jgi:flavin-dependent thymidylate synthase